MQIIIAMSNICFFYLSKLIAWAKYLYTFYIHRENTTQDEPIDPVNIDDHDLPNYGSPSTSDSDDLPNAEESEDNIPFEASSLI